MKWVLKVCIIIFWWCGREFDFMWQGTTYFILWFSMPHKLLSNSLHSLFQLQRGFFFLLWMKFLYGNYSSNLRFICKEQQNPTVLFCNRCTFLCNRSVPDQFQYFVYHHDELGNTCTTWITQYDLLSFRVLK